MSKKTATVCLLLVAAIVQQVASADEGQQNPAPENPVMALQEERRQLAADFRALKEQYASADSKTRSEAFREWRERTRPRLEELSRQQRAVLEARQEEDPAAQAREEQAFRQYLASLPEDVRQTVQTRKQMADEFKALREQYKDASSAKRVAAFKQWREANQPRIQQLREATMARMKESTRSSVMDDPVKRQAFLESLPEERRADIAERLALHGEHKALREQTADADSKTRSEAFRQWREQNRGRIQQLQRRALDRANEGALSTPQNP